MTYPLTNQMVITNGKWWTFCVYQLNTTLMHTWHNDENPRRNMCWISKPMKLFEKIEDDQVHGLNEEVLEHLVKFYVNEPRERVGVQMKPYLQNGDGLVANVIGNMKRTWLEERFKLLQSNRPRHRFVSLSFFDSKNHVTRRLQKKLSIQCVLDYIIIVNECSSTTDGYLTIFTSYFPSNKKFDFPNFS